MSQEMKDKIVELTIENERIKKTSTQRFNKNKALESEMKYLKLQNGRLEAIKTFLSENDFPSKHERGIYSVSFTVFNAIRSLQNKSKKMKTPETNGTYAVKIEGEWYIKEVLYILCWSFIENDKPVGVHFYKVDEFILLNPK